MSLFKIIYITKVDFCIFLNLIIEICSILKKTSLAKLYTTYVWLNQNCKRCTKKCWFSLQIFYSSPYKTTLWHSATKSMKKSLNVLMVANCQLWRSSNSFYGVKTYLNNKRQKQNSWCEPNRVVTWNNYNYP